MITTAQKQELCNGYMSALVNNLVGLELANIYDAIQSIRELGESNYTIRQLAVTLRVVVDCGREATGTPANAVVFGNPDDLEFEGD